MITFKQRQQQAYEEAQINVICIYMNTYVYIHAYNVNLNAA